MSVQAVILAGGMGTRLRPLTLNRPKPIVPLVNVPFLQHQLALLGAHGITDVILSVSHMPDVIRTTMGDGRAAGVRLRYVVEEEPLGTAGGVRNAADLVDGRVVVLNGDILTDVDLRAMLDAHEARRAKASIFLTPVENPTAYGLVELEPDGRVRRFLEKPGWDEVTTNTINAGIYILERELLALIPKGQAYSMEREFFPMLLERRVPFLGHVPRAYWLDIGTAVKYLQAHQDLLDRLVQSHVSPPGRRVQEGWIDPSVDLHSTVRLRAPVVIGPGCRLEKDVVVGPGAVLGPGCRLEAAAHVETTVLWDEVSVGAGARLHGCLVGRGCRIGAHAEMGAGSVLGDGSALSDYSRLAVSA
ncbi:MAG TPA: NDP-sugar synthase [Methylomirabilota bacterium]|nr:NDP-sugar synthase [Methylomirabilota bacterium]